MGQRCFAEARDPQAVTRRVPVPGSRTVRRQILTSFLARPMANFDADWQEKAPLFLARLVSSLGFA